MSTTRPSLPLNFPDHHSQASCPHMGITLGVKEVEAQFEVRENFGNNFKALPRDERPALYLTNSVGFMIGGVNFVDVSEYPRARLYRSKHDIKDVRVRQNYDDFEYEDIENFYEEATAQVSG